MRECMNQYNVTPVDRKKIGSGCAFVDVPGSKSITNRAILLAMLAEGQTTIRNALFSDDSRVLMECVRKLGYPIHINETKQTVTISGNPSKIPKREAELYVGSAGTAARFLTALLGISGGKYFLDASEQMRKRPMAPLIASMKELGAVFTYSETENHFPFLLESSGVTKQEVAVDINDSSQFLSALMMASVMSNKDFTIHIKGHHGMAYIEITAAMMKDFGVLLHCQKEGEAIKYIVPGNQRYHALDYTVEADVSASCYFFAMAMLLGTKICVHDTKLCTKQGDIALLSTFCKMGGKVYEEPFGIVMEGPKGGNFSGVDVDMSSFSDQALTLAVLAPFADSPTTITGIGHTRMQESNRIAVILSELSKLGVRCEELSDGIKIYPGNLHGGVVSTYDDHRVAMSFALAGLRVPGIIIENPLCCKKTFEGYFETLEHTIASITERQ